jgi:acyl carrier protein
MGLESQPAGRGDAVSIEDDIRRFISVELRPAETDVLTDTYPLLDRQVLDSMGLFQLVAYLEDELGVEIGDDELVPEHFGTISSIAHLVRSKRAA